MFGLGFSEVLVILAVVLLVVGPEKLPELARTLGRTMWQLRRAADEFREEVQLSRLDLPRNPIGDELNDIRNIAKDCPEDSANASPAATTMAPQSVDNQSPAENKKGEENE